MCHVCAMAVKTKKLLPNRGDAAFVSNGFGIWNDATVGFNKHEASLHHRDAVQMMLRRASDVGEMLSKEHANQKAENRTCLLKILSNLQFLSRQGLPLRGDGTNEDDSNFKQLLKLRALDDPVINTWLEKKRDKYVSHDIQNELLQEMAHSLLRRVTNRIRDAQFFCSYGRRMHGRLQ